MKLAKILVLMAAIALIAPAGAALGAEKIGVIDVRKCIQLTEQGKATFRELKAEVDKLQAELREKEKEIEAIRTKLEKGVGVLSDSARVSLEGELRRKSRSYRDLYEDSQARIRQLEGERSRPILNRLLALAKEIGKRDGYAIIIDSRAGLLYFDSGRDITNQVIDEYNKKYPVTKGKNSKKKAK